MKAKRFMVIFILSILCVYPFFDGIEANSSFKQIEQSQDYPDFVRSISSNAKNVYKNDKGFWEVEFDHGVIMIYIPSGEFQMGSDEGKKQYGPIRISGKHLGIVPLFW